MPVYPWQVKPWQLIQSMVTTDRLPHALLISGLKGMGLFEFASNFASSILCEQALESGEQCHRCSACNLIKAETHPDLLIVEPEEEGKAIKIDQIRKLVSFSQFQSHYSKRKVIIICPAEAMNTSSANSLLKTLEEPPGDTLIILVSQQPSMLPITVRSRCQKIKISATSTEVEEWLSDKVELEKIQTALASGCGPLFFDGKEELDQSIDRKSLLDDLELMSNKQKDPIDTAEQWSKKQPHETFFWLLNICQDMLKLSSIDNPNQAKLVNQDLCERLHQLAKQYETKGIFNIYDKLFEYHRLISTNTSVKTSTMFEDLTVEWVNLRRL